MSNTSKITDHELQVFAESAGLGKQVVIVKVAGNSIRLKRPQRGLVGITRSFVAEIAAGPSAEETKDKMDEFEAILRDLGIYDKKTTRLDSATSYAVQVTPKQLKALTALPLVAQIIANAVSQR
jgi:hypothetical protein